MTERIYDTDSHVTCFSARVAACEPAGDAFDIVLDRTAFFPGGGGQEPDQGTLDDAPVLCVYEKEETIYHRISRPLLPGSEVTGRIDWALRFSNMQQHSGEHIMCSILHNRYGVDNVGFHMGSAEVTLDVNGTFSMETLLDVEKEANALVAANKPITVSYPDEAALAKMSYRSKIEILGRTRIVTIGPEEAPDDRCACCAPHVMRTGEVGLIKVLACQRYKGGTRISILCGRRALAAVNVFQDQVQQIDRLLSAIPAETAETVQKLKAVEEGRKEQVVRVQRRMIRLLAEQIPPGSEPICLFEDLEDVTCAREYVNLATLRRQGPVALFLPRGDGFQYIIGGTAVKQLGQAVNQALNGRGGGSEAMVQGTVHASRDMVEAFFSQTASASTN